MSDIETDEHFQQSKHLRLNSTNKRLRHLRAFERIHYKKTWEVKKTGHGIVDEHEIHDGGLRCLGRPVTYSLNKKKRWLLPSIIEERIRQFDRNDTENENDLNHKLKIEMFENENVHLKSTCFRYANSQMTPQIIYKNGRCFNGRALSTWINFETRSSRPRRHSRHDENQPNFGIQNRPGFFPSEVKYEFLYPRCVSVRGKSKLIYREGSLDDYGNSRHSRDTNKNRRLTKRRDCFVDFNDENQQIDDDDDDEEEEEEEEEEEIDFISVSTPKDYPIEFFITSEFEEEIRSIPTNEPNSDRKSRKIYPNDANPSDSTEEEDEEEIESSETLICSLDCLDQSEFISQMQNFDRPISQANVSPAMFVQRINKSPFYILYSYSSRSSSIDVTVKFSKSSPKLNLSSNLNSLTSIVSWMWKKLEEYQCKSNKTTFPHVNPKDVDALRGSLPLPRAVTENLILVRPNSTDKETALLSENLNEFEQFSIEKTSSSADCSICCETLSSDEVFRLLPCKHSLCYECLNSFIRTTVSTNSTLKCFQTNCSTTLNSSLIRAFVSFDVFDVYERNSSERKLFSSGIYRKCPSRLCSKLLIVDDVSKPSLMCSCGQRVCSTCLDEHHFPATCQQYKSYFKRLRESGDDLLSVSSLGDRNDCYIAEGKNCPTCGEFVEKNGGCPHMTCKCSYEFCWACLKRWETHNSAFCTTVPESTHELRSSFRNRLHNRALNRRRDRNFYSYSLLSGVVRRSKFSRNHHDILLATFIELNTISEFLYVVLQRRKLDSNLRSVLTRTARQFEIEASTLKIALNDDRPNLQHIESIRMKLTKTISNLNSLKNRKILL